MASGKHSSDDSFEFDFSFFKKINWIKILIFITIAIVVAGAIYVAKRVIDSKKVEPVINEPVIEEPKLEEVYEGYSVLGKIKIDKINVEQYILDSKEDEALEKGVTKLYGDTLNEVGNFCIAGHNKENIFEKLNELEKGDSFIIIDKDLKETEYEIKEIEGVEPDDLTCLLPNEEKVEITLITCDNASTTRLVVKAEVKENDKASETENVVEDEKVKDSEDE